MPRTCTVCAHADRHAIDKAIVAGGSLAAIAAKYRVSPDAVERHSAAHLPVKLVKAEAAAEVADADDLLSQVKTLQRRTLTILDTAEGMSDLPTALRAIGEARRNLELLAKLTGELDERAQINVLLAPEWVQIRTLVLTALESFPEAKRAVAANLATLEAVNG